MNTSLFVGLCEDAGFEVEFNGSLVGVSTYNHIPVAVINEKADSLYWIDTYGTGREEAAALSEIVVAYALTPIEERE